MNYLRALEPFQFSNLVKRTKKEQTICIIIEDLFNIEL